MKNNLKIFFAFILGIVLSVTGVVIADGIAASSVTFDSRQINSTSAGNVQNAIEDLFGYYNNVKSQYENKIDEYSFSNKIYYGNISPSCNSTADYTALNKDIFLRYEAYNNCNSLGIYSMCIIKDSKLKCLYLEDYEVAKTRLKSTLNTNDCYESENGYECTSSPFTCTINKNGYSIECRNSNTIRRCTLTNSGGVCSN